MNSSKVAAGSERIQNDGPIKRKKKKTKKKAKKVKVENEDTKQDIKQEEQTTQHVNEEEKEKESKGRMYTVSIALPGSIIDNAQSPELRSYLAGQVARACAVFQVDEIVVFRDVASAEQQVSGVFQGAKKQTDPAVFLARVLQYMETPQYLRKALFPMHTDLKYAGLLNPLDAPHHMRIDEVSLFREGITLKRPIKAGKGSFVDCGMRKEVQIDKALKPGLRVTVKLDNNGELTRTVRGQVVRPSAPREDNGQYWGYSVRMAKTFTDIFSECPYENGYDLTIGTSERGQSVHEYSMPSFKHIIVVFGGLHGLEAVVDSDAALSTISDPSQLFDTYLNTCTAQGSRTIRTEEAMLITMSALSNKIQQSGSKI